MADYQFGPQDALLIIDVQNDFFSAGKLPVKDAEALLPPINRWARRAEEGGATIVATRDWHPEHHASFQERGGPWPEHCLQNSWGAAFHPQLQVKPSWIIVDKGINPNADSLSAFDHTQLAGILKRRGVACVWISGLALDVCVKASAADALSLGFTVLILKDACKALNATTGEQSLRELEERGASLIEGENDEESSAYVHAFHRSLRTDNGSSLLGGRAQ